MVEKKHTGGRQKGTVKTGGRKKGTPNKRTKAVKDLIDDKGVNPIEAMAECLKEAIEEGDSQKVVYIAEKLAPYYAPKLASSKVEATVSRSLEDMLDELDVE